MENKQQNPSILVVEDDRALAMGIEFALSREGFNVTLAPNLKEAHKSLSSGDYDLILLDVMLPDGSGYDFCRAVRQSSRIPVIFLTACDEEVNIVLGLDIGGDDYITKPFRVKELVSRIKAVLRRQSGQGGESGSLLMSGEISLNLLETRALKKGKELQLTPAEYKLLAIFLQNPGQTLSRELLLEKLWDIEGEFVDGNTLTVYIRRLREKLEDDPSSPQYIVTVRGMGYKWEKAHS